MTKSEFISELNTFYKTQKRLGDTARYIIREFLAAHNGLYVFDTEKEDCIWVGECRYVTKIEIDGNNRILVHNSECYSEYLYDMDDYNILDLAEAIVAIQNDETY